MLERQRCWSLLGSYEISGNGGAMYHVVEFTLGKEDSTRSHDDLRASLAGSERIHEAEI